MNHVIKKKFLNAIRNNSYELGSSLFSEGGRLNPLGVLCKVTGNLLNRDITQKFPRVDTAGRVQEFMGLSPYVQEQILSIASRHKSWDKVASYISRNVKVTA